MCTTGLCRRLVMHENIKVTLLQKMLQEQCKQTIITCAVVTGTIISSPHVLWLRCTNVCLY